MTAPNQNLSYMDESLIEDSFSSNVHPVELFGKETKEAMFASDYHTPERYNKDCLELLPVNVKSAFVYWELTDATVLQKRQLTYVVKLVEKNGGHESELVRFLSREQIGKQYFNHYMPSKTVFAVIGYLDASGNFVELLRSRVFAMPGDTIAQTDDQIWMSNKEDWMELVKSSSIKYGETKDSAAYVHEMEMLKNFRRLNTFSTTSAQRGEFGFIGSSELCGRDFFGSSHHM